MILPWHLYVMASIYILAGLNHFRDPKLYLKIIPPYVPYPAQVNYISGAAELILGTALCFPSATTVIAWGIIALLIAVFPANIYMFTNDRARLGFPSWLLLVRLPLQVVLIIWAYLYT